MRIYGSPPARPQQRLGEGGLILVNLPAEFTGLPLFGPQRRLGQGGLILVTPWARDEQNKATLHYQLIWKSGPDPHVCAQVCINLNNVSTNYHLKIFFSDLFVVVFSDGLPKCPDLLVSEISRIDHQPVASKPLWAWCMCERRHE